MATSNGKSVSGGFYQLKIDVSPDYKDFFGYDGPKVLILSAGGIKRVFLSSDHWKITGAVAVPP